VLDELRRRAKERYYRHVLSQFSQFSDLDFVASIWSVRRSTVRHWIAKGWMRAFRIGKIWYVNRGDALRQYGKTGKISVGQHRRYEQERMAKDVEVHLNEALKPEGDTGDNTRH
jgi:hypothetical protein